MSLDGVFNSFKNTGRVIDVNQWVQKLGNVVSGESNAEKDIREKAKEKLRNHNASLKGNHTDYDGILDTAPERDLIESFLKGIDGDTSFSEGYLDGTKTPGNDDEKIEAYLTKDIFEKDGSNFQIKDDGLFYTSVQVSSVDALNITDANIDETKLPSSVLNQAERKTELLEYFNEFKDDFAEIGFGDGTDTTDTAKVTRALNEFYEAAI